MSPSRSWTVEQYVPMSARRITLLPCARGYLPTPHGSSMLRVICEFPHAQEGETIKIRVKRAARVKIRLTGTFSGAGSRPQANGEG